ncbi:MAG: (Fe-S)-binding protein [Candidatus Schekmanbacteria bacterium]|nr:(Fe-S)-binding protein [Candidatus Schekmanbacteria bacterium]
MQALLTNRYETLEQLRPLSGKCPRCNLCKFPPLTIVERKEAGTICPSYDELKGHFNSGGGMVTMSNSLVDGRSRVTEAVRRAVFACTACGGCDVSCKFSSDIEVQEVILALRARVFTELGPLPEHARVLETVRRQGHPLPEADAEGGDWREHARPSPVASATTVVWIGPHFRHLRHHHEHLRAIFRLLDAAGIRYRLLDAEPYTGRAALEIGDRALFVELAAAAAAALDRARAQEVVCLSAEDYATLRNQVPRHAPVRARIRHLTEVYAEALARGRLTPRHRQCAAVGWHDSPYLGRLSEPFRPWEGREERRFGQMVVTVPPRPVNHGREGCYEAPRQLLGALPGLIVRELFRRREYAYDAGETGQAWRAFPDLARHAAERRLREAVTAGIDTVVSECPQTHAHLSAAVAGGAVPQVRVATLSELLATAVFGYERSAS